MNPIITYLISNWKFVLYIAIALLLILFFVVREIKLATIKEDGKIDEVHFDSIDSYRSLCLPITGKPCKE
jgi:hypothetical protein